MSSSDERQSEAAEQEIVRPGLGRGLVVVPAAAASGGGERERENQGCEQRRPHPSGTVRDGRPFGRGKLAA
jgi:hypothetical protein